MPKKLKFEKDDLIGDTLSIQKELSLNIPIVDFNNDINGHYSFFKKTKVFFWESSIQTSSEMVVSFCPSIKPSYFYLLSFESSKNLNRRIIIDLPINADLLDNQSKKGSLFWVSSVGIELMIPDNTQIDFQLIGISQDRLLNYLTPPFFYKKHNISIFYFSPISSIFQNTLFNINETKETQNRIPRIMGLITNYLVSDNEKLSQEALSFMNFYNTLLIEKMVRQLSAVREPNVDLLSDEFGYSSKKLNGLFLRVFGMTIIEYHRGFHMKYAKWLIEEKQMKIDEVSRALGFKTTSLFAQVFKRHYFYMPQKCKPIKRMK